MKVLDTTFLIDLIRGRSETRSILGKDLLTTQINMYEVLTGLFFKSISSRQFPKILEMFENIRVLPLDDNAITQAARITADLMKSGTVIEDCDCLIAGIALSNGIDTIVTKNRKHFARIKGIKVQTY